VAVHLFASLCVCEHSKVFKLYHILPQNARSRYVPQILKKHYVFNPPAVQEAIKKAHDPLGFNIVGQSQALLQKIGQNIQNVQDKLHLEGLAAQPPTSTVSQALNAASNLLSVPAFTLLVADIFRPLLIDLCVRWIDNNGLDEVDRFVALCFLVEPYEEVFP
jgi:hypothetical protein